MAAVFSLISLVTLLFSSLSNLRHHYANPCCLPVFHLHITCVLSLVSSPANHAFPYDYLQLNTSVTSVYLYSNPIGDSGGASLCSMLKVWCTFVLLFSTRKLCLWYTYTPEKQLSESFQSGSCQKHGLSLSRCSAGCNPSINPRLSSSQPRWVLYALQVNQSLVELGLVGDDDNNLSEKDVLALSDALKVE